MNPFLFTHPSAVHAAATLFYYLLGFRVVYPPTPLSRGASLHNGSPQGEEVLGTNYAVLDTPGRVLNTNYAVLGTNYTVLGSPGPHATESVGQTRY